MGWWNEIFNRGGYTADTHAGANWVQEFDNGDVFYQYIANMAGRLGQMTKFSGNSPYLFATSLAEIFIPIDTISEKVASCEFVLFSKSTDAPVKRIPTRIKELMTQPNPFQDLSGLVYDIQFSELAAGGSYTLTKKPESLKGKSYEYITNIWSLNPDLTEPKVFTTIPDPFLINSPGELIESYRTHFIRDVVVRPDEITMNVITRLNDDMRPITPLTKVEKNINNLLAVYSARYNVFVNNGSAKIISKKASSRDFGDAIDPANRQTILDDISRRDGIVGGRNFIGISGTPLEAIETLGKIKELEPFKETFTDLITIGAIYNVDKELLPKEESTTYSNKESAERHLWINTIVPYAYCMGRTLTKAMWLPDDYEIRPVFDKVDVLQADRKVQAEAEGLELDNVSKKKELGMDITNDIEKWKQKD